MINEEVLRNNWPGKDDFADNELAYLCLTSKIELPFRDKLAFNLHRNIGDKCLVAREWKRRDIAILSQSGEPADAIIELKALHSADFTNQKKLFSYNGKIAEDIDKAKKEAQQTAHIYTVLLVVHPNSIIPKEIESICKYNKRINGAFSRYKDQGEIRNQVIENVSEVLPDMHGMGQKPLNLNPKGASANHFWASIDAGKAMGIHWEVLCWAFEWQ